MHEYAYFMQPQSMVALTLLRDLHLIDGDQIVGLSSVDNGSGDSTFRTE